MQSVDTRVDILKNLVPREHVSEGTVQIEGEVFNVTLTREERGVGRDACEMIGIQVRHAISGAGVIFSLRCSDGKTRMKASLRTTHELSLNLNEVLDAGITVKASQPIKRKVVRY